MADDILTQIDRELLAWPGVTKAAGHIHSTAYRFGRRKIGHIHGNRVADFMVPKTLRAELLASGGMREHQAGVPRGISDNIHNDDPAGVIALFRLNFERRHAIADQRPLRRLRYLDVFHKGVRGVIPKTPPVRWDGRRKDGA